MEPVSDVPGPDETGVSAGAAVTVRYWAAARAAAGTGADRVAVSGPISLTDLRARVLDLHPEAHPGAPLADVLAVCSVLIGDRPVATQDPGLVVVEPGDTVEFLPPFAGG